MIFIQKIFILKILMNYKLTKQVSSAQEYLLKYHSDYQKFIQRYQKTECHIALQFIEWYHFVSTFIRANQSINYQNLSKIEIFDKIFHETSINSLPLICNNEFPEDQILTEYQILLKSLLS